MKDFNYYRPRHCAAKEFSQWAQMFSGEIFVKLAAYIDEAGRHDKTGQQPGSGQIVVAGWVDWWDNWSGFCREWESALKKYNAPYFHFYEWVEASKVAAGRKPSSSFCNNPYSGWESKKLWDFILETAAIAGGGNKIFVGGFISTKDFHAAKNDPVYKHFPRVNDDPYRACLNQFFNGFINEVQQQWPYWTEPVTFFFDQNDDRDWGHAVQDAHAAAQKKDARIAEIAFANKKNFPHWPLQAADMVAYRFRQIAQNYLDPEVFPKPTELDDLLIKPTISKASPAYREAALSDAGSLLGLRFANYPWRKQNQS